jgi:hypothetical protein
LLIFSVLLNFGQTNTFCDTIYEHPETLPQFTNDTKGLTDYFHAAFIPILNDCLKQDGEIVSSLRMQLTIDKTGKVIAVNFLRLQASDTCINKLTNEILSMTGWTAGKMNGNTVCSIYYWQINCILWK